MDTSQLEYSIVGAICIDPKICDKISGILSPDDFSISACGEVYEAACDALSRGKHFDAVLAADAIRNRVDDAVRFIGECMSITPTTANAESHAKLLHRRAGETRFKLAVQEALEGEDAAAAVAGICQNFLQANAGGGLQSIGHQRRSAGLDRRKTRRRQSSLCPRPCRVRRPRRTQDVDLQLGNAVR